MARNQKSLCPCLLNTLRTYKYIVKAHNGSSEPVNSPVHTLAAARIAAYKSTAAYLVRQLGRVDSRIRYRRPVLPVSPPVLHAVRDCEHDRGQRSEELQRAGDREALTENTQNASATAQALEVVAWEWKWEDWTLTCSVDPRSRDRDASRARSRTARWPCTSGCPSPSSSPTRGCVRLPNAHAVSQPVSQSVRKLAQVREADVHHAMMTPIIVYVPLTMQNVAK